MMVAGSAFAYNTTDENLYGIGRTLSFFSASFLPVALYMIYREFTVGRPEAPSDLDHSDHDDRADDHESAA
jgi:hypothetical protein